MSPNGIGRGNLLYFIKHFGNKHKLPSITAFFSFSIAQPNCLYYRLKQKLHRESILSNATEFYFFPLKSSRQRWLHFARITEYNVGQQKMTEIKEEQPNDRLNSPQSLSTSPLSTITKHPQSVLRIKFHSKERKEGEK